MVSKEFFKDLFRAYPEEPGAYYLYDTSGEVIGVQATQEYKWFTFWMGAPKMTATPGNMSTCSGCLYREPKRPGTRRWRTWAQAPQT
jgi:hypothetical protein